MLAAGIQFDARLLSRFPRRVEEKDVEVKDAESHQFESGRQPSMIYHQATILHNSHSRFGQLFGDDRVADTQLHPNRLWFFRKQIIQMRRNVLRTAEDIHHVNIFRNVVDAPVNSFAENRSHIRVVNRDWDDLKAGGLHVLGNIEGGLIGLLFSFDTENRNRLGLRKQLANLFRAGDEIVAPVHSHR